MGTHLGVAAMACRALTKGCAGRGAGHHRLLSQPLTVHQLPPQEVIPGAPSIKGGTRNVPTQHVRYQTVLCIDWLRAGVRG